MMMTQLTLKSFHSFIVCKIYHNKYPEERKTMLIMMISFDELVGPSIDRSSWLNENFNSKSMN